MEGLQQTEEIKCCIRCGDPGEFYKRTDNGKEANICKRCSITAAVENKRRKRAGNALTAPSRDPQDEEPGEIECSTCKIPKPKKEFSPRNDRPGQYYTTCKSCRRDKEAERRLRKINKKKKYFSFEDFAGIEDHYNN